MSDVKALTEAVFRQVHAYVSPALIAVQRQVVELETKLAAVPAGARGPSGDVGAPGADAYEIARSRGFAGTVDEWLSSLKGANGERGEKGEGERGPQGEPGKDGAPGKGVDREALAVAIADGVEKALPGAVQKALDALIPELASKAAALIPPPKDGVDGKSPDEAAILASVTEKMLRAVDALPKAQDGRDGRDAPEVDTEALALKVLALVPKPRDGVDGKDADVDVQEIVAKAVALIPAPQNGVDGKDGRDGIDGKSVTLDDLTPAFEAKAAGWQLEFERRAADVLRGAIDKMPAPAHGQDGRDGKDGFSPDDFEVTLDGRVFTFALRCGERVVTREIKVPFPVDRGVYRTGTLYEKGDVATFGGSQWIALNDTRDKPPSDNWRCQVRRGQDGKA